jgi:hypothetical protein
LFLQVVLAFSGLWLLAEVAWGQPYPSATQQGTPWAGSGALTSWPVEHVPQAMVRDAAGRLVMASRQGIEVREADGRLVAGWAPNFPQGTTCAWTGREATLFGLCERTWREGEGQNAVSWLDLGQARCTEGRCELTSLLVTREPETVRGLWTGSDRQGQPATLVLRRSVAATETRAAEPEQVELFVAGRKLLAQEVRRQELTDAQGGGGGVRGFLRGQVGRAGRVDARAAQRPDGSWVLGIRVGTELRLWDQGSARASVRSSYRWHLLADEVGNVHAVWFEPGARALHHGTLPPGAGVFTETLVDAAESGFESHAEVIGTAVHVWYYFYRNAFYKGIRHVERPLHGGVGPAPRDILYSETENMGWGVVASPRLQQDGTFCYGTGQSARLTLSMNQAPEITGGQCTTVASLQAVAAQPPRFPRYRPFFFMAGGGVWARPWWMWTVQPDPQEDLQGRGDPFALRYRIGSAIQNEAVLEGRVGRTRLGLSYARSLAQEVEDVVLGGLDLPPVVAAQLRGVISYDRLIANHDLQLQFRSSQMNVTVRDDNDPDNAQTNVFIQSDATEVWVSALNIYRMRYGLRYQNFATSVPVYTYGVGANQTEYQYLPSLSGVAPVRMHDIGVIFGYSLLDYAVKYETRVSRLYLDTTLGAGIALAEFLDGANSPLAGLPDGELRTPIVLSLFGEAEVGWLAYRRFASLSQAGLYAKIGLRTWLEWRGSSGRPSERESSDEGFDEARYQSTFQLTDLRLGPFLQAGMVF